MAGLNKVHLIGNLGRNAELKYTTTGAAVATLSLATTEKWKDKTSGQPKEMTEWHRIVVWGKTAEVLAEFLVKGKQIYVEGRLQTREWTNKEGQKVRTTEIRADRVTLLGGGGKGSHNDAPHPADEPVSDAPGGDSGGDDDIPF